LARTKEEACLGLICSVVAYQLSRKEGGQRGLLVDFYPMEHCTAYRDIQNSREREA